MFKKSKTVMALLALCSGAAFAASDPNIQQEPSISTTPKSVQDKITQRVQSWFDIEVKAHKSVIQKMVFDCEFFSATPYLKSPDGSESRFDSYLFYSQAGTLGSMTEPYTTQVLPELLTCLKPNFIITHQDQAQLLFEAIENVYPSQSIFDRHFDTEVIKTLNGWTFIDGEMFDDKTGYIIDTNDKGEVIKIIRSLNL
ncbi:hypothetical protein [Vibrio gallaecicus]|uniref:Uncharacterized protein n=1 Tax=Vibrio gallaecicus TaxID=552386 RepID=A0ABV4N9C1_9VIBR